jgi:hypothetical protein
MEDLVRASDLDWSGTKCSAKGSQLLLYNTIQCCYHLLSLAAGKWAWLLPRGPRWPAFTTNMRAQLISRVHLAMPPPLSWPKHYWSTRHICSDLNYRKMAALVAIEQDSHILTLTGLSLDIMRLVGISHTVLVPYIFGKNISKHCITLLLLFQQ